MNEDYSIVIILNILFIDIYFDLFFSYTTDNVFG